MTQLIKHYLIDRDNGRWATYIPLGYIMPNINGLETKHSLFTQERVPFFLSEVPDYFEYEVVVPQQEVIEYQNNLNITVISSTERQIEVSVSTRPDLEQTEETRTEIVYDVVYRKSHVLSETEGEGLKILTQQEWDDEISRFDSYRIQDRYNTLREIRDKILELTDWMVIKFPTLPTELQGHSEIISLYDRFDEVKSISMIHDPLI